MLIQYSLSPCHCDMDLFAHIHSLGIKLSSWCWLNQPYHLSTSIILCIGDTLWPIFRLSAPSQYTLEIIKSLPWHSSHGTQFHSWNIKNKRPNICVLELSRYELLKIAIFFAHMLLIFKEIEDKCKKSFIPMPIFQILTIF